MYRRILIILFLSISLSDVEPFYNYKHDKVYSIVNNGLIPVIDGNVDDSCWVGVSEIESFTQLEPDYNVIPTEKTIVKIIQDEYAIYISAYLYDSYPSGIVQKFINRDDFVKLSMSDWFSISIDSQHDHQTGYEFIVNAAGVQFDSFLFDDVEGDPNWDGVWESMTAINNKGWSLEMRIPFSSLRYSNDEDDSEWGVNIKRYIHRKNEYIEWVVLPKGTIAEVSKFGHLNNIRNTKSETFIEVNPYIYQGQLRYDDIILNDLYKQKLGWSPWDTTFFYNKIGLDVKVHLSNNTIMDFTTLPDFGQIESDPADINFEYYDTYFEEKRNFFLENTTLFDSPVDLFYSRRIGENPLYESRGDEQLKEALVLGATKITGKTKSNISYGFISAMTLSKGRKDSPMSINLDQPIHNYAVGRLSKDILSGNSYFGVTGTAFENYSGTSWALSYDGLYYLLNNNLFLDSQIIYSHTNNSGHGFGSFLEFEYSFPNFITLGSSMEYYNPNLDINDVGYLIRNDLFQLNNKLKYHNETLLLGFGVRQFNLIFNYLIAKDSKMEYILGQAFNSMLKIDFKNYSILDISHTFTGERFEDRLYDFTKDELYKDEIGKIPASQTIQLDFSTDPSYKYYFDFTYTHTKTTLDEKGNGYVFRIGANITEDSDLELSFIKNSGNEKYRFIEPIFELSDNGVDTVTHFIFSNDRSIEKKFTIRYNKFFQNGINLQLYHEYFAESHAYDNYSELKPGFYYPISNTEYILADDFYCSITDPRLDDDEQRCILNPNDYIYRRPNYNELNLNVVLSWEYSTRSNIYLIYKIKKAIIGDVITNYTDFVDYIQFFNYKAEENKLNEIWNDQSIFIKIDYWFDF